MGYVGVVEAFKQLNTQQAREVILNTQQNLVLREGEESTIKGFNEKLHRAIRHLQALQNQMMNSDISNYERLFVEDDIRKAKENLESLDLVARLVSRADMIAVMAGYVAQDTLDKFAERASSENEITGDITRQDAIFELYYDTRKRRQYYGDDIDAYDSVVDFRIAQGKVNKVMAAAVTDLTPTAYTLLQFLSFWDTTNEELLAIIATEVEQVLTR